MIDVDKKKHLLTRVMNVMLAWMVDPTDFLTPKKVTMLGRSSPKE